MIQAGMARAIKSDQWVTDDDVPDLAGDELPNVPGYFLLIRPVSVKQETKGGIILPDSTQEDMAYLTTVGKVLAVGDLAYLDKEKFANGPWCKAGDYVCYGKHAGTKFHYKGHKLILLFDDQVMMTVNDPTELDPTYSLSN